MISTFNEWDPLKRVVVGDASYANWPTNDPVFQLEAERTLWKETPLPQGPVPQHIIDEANEDLDTLSQTLTQLGVKVDRPDTYNFQRNNGLYHYCPRDRFLVWGSTIIDPPMMYPCRDQEYGSYIHILNKSKSIVHMRRENNRVLDAANILRLNDTWLFLESDSGNRAAYNWLVNRFPEVNIELCNFYAGVHIDSTVVPLREGLVMLNASRVNESNCPRVFDTWEKIWVTDVVAQNFYEYPYASKWIALNMLVVDPHTVIVDRNQPDLIKILETHKFTVIPLELRHSRTLGGGFHCVTLDLIRDSNK